MQANKCKPDAIYSQPVAVKEAHVTVKVPPAVHVKLSPEIIALCSGVIRYDVLATGKAGL